MIGDVVIDRRQVLTGGSMSIDRRSEYREKVAAEIEKDPLDFYIRAERGRKMLQPGGFVQGAAKPASLCWLRGVMA